MLFNIDIPLITVVINSMTSIAPDNLPLRSNSPPTGDVFNPTPFVLLNVQIKEKRKSK